MATRERPKVVIVGAGFGGISAARSLRKASVDVVVLDRNNYHGFWPFLYQVATGILETQEIAYPVRSLLRRQKNVDFRMADVLGVDFERREVETDRGRHAYDYLVLAGGSATNFFGNDELADHTHGLKDIDDADRLRNHILRCFEEAAAQSDNGERSAPLLTFVIVGGGPTGVELAGQLALLAHRTLPREFPNLDLSHTRVVLVNAGGGILESFPEPLQAHARRRLKQLGVELRLNETVESVEHGIVRFAHGSQLEATTVVWAAGVRAAELSQKLDAPLGPGGRVRIEPELNVPGHPEVFVVGDMAYLEGYGDGAYPMVAQVAMQQGRRAARNIAARIAGAPLHAFRYRDKGQMAMIGRRSAIVDGFGVRLRGAPGWLAWLGLHVLYLRGLRNRMVVVLDWIAVFVSPTRSTGIITRPR